ncbi:fluoride efflux transporter CrcB [Micromonospora polyrhachis]|uniref:Fluoride-specific ion channel FluC n=1 Tax=Micromonospora polyrhachis TaxID=1282883 RepID=A0A7W7WQB0_9ACTN|nr:fluoride efflux transporter CrcB [Micromonospora polyrhachis]MBB4959088.1 CrcB protein [Micromonospora polyrhachis]
MSPAGRPAHPAGRLEQGVLAAVAVGGALGSAARYGLAVLWPNPGGLPWATLTTNLLGCALLGALMQAVTKRVTAHRLLRPFLGTGVLGGFTTFSTYAVETRQLLASGRPGLALAYALGTLVGALFAVRLGMWLSGRVPARARSDRKGPFPTRPRRGE